jgi:hypothetical protein
MESSSNSIDKSPCRAIGQVLGRHSTIEPVTIPAAGPLVPHTRSKHRLIPKPRRVKRDTTKLGGESSLRPLKTNLFLLVLQLIVMSEHICGRTTPAKSNKPDELPNLNDSIRHKLMQLNPELAQDVHKNRMWQHAKASSKEIHKHHSFNRSRTQNRFTTRRSAVSLQKKRL